MTSLKLSNEFARAVWQIASYFDDVPQADLVYAWDAAARRYRFAARNGLGTLRTLSPGAGLAIRIGGAQTVDWIRPQLQPRPIIQLVWAWNFVAWSGAEGTALAAATDGVGSSG